MPKTEIVRYHALAPKVDGVNIPRIQTLSVSVDKARDPVSELGNTGIVQYIEQVPSVTITMDTNLIGSTDTMALVNDAIIDKTADVETTPGLDPRYTSTGGASRLNYINLNTSNSTALTITEAHILDAYCHVTIPVTEDGTTVARTAWIPRAALSGMTLSFDVNGNATENYTLQGSKTAWFFNGWKNAQCHKLLNVGVCTAGDATAGSSWDTQRATAQTFYAQCSAVPEGSSVLAMAVNEKVFYSTKGFQFTDAVEVLAGATAMYPAVAGTKWKMSTAADGSMEFSTPWATKGDDVYVIFSPIDSTAWTDERNTSTAGSVGALARQHVNIWYYNTQHDNSKTTSTAMGQTLRVQSVSIEVSPGAESLLELGAKEPYGYVRNTPIPINVTMTVNDADLEIWAGLAGKDYTTNTQVLLEDMNTYNNIRIDVFKEETKVVATERTMEVLLTGMEVTGVRTNVSAGGNSTHEFTLLGDDIAIKGTGINPNT